MASKSAEKITSQINATIIQSVTLSPLFFFPCSKKKYKNWSIWVRKIFVCLVNWCVFFCRQASVIDTQHPGLCLHHLINWIRDKLYYCFDEKHFHVFLLGWSFAINIYIYLPYPTWYVLIRHPTSMTAFIHFFSNECWTHFNNKW